MHAMCLLFAVEAPGVDVASHLKNLIAAQSDLVPVQQCPGSGGRLHCH